MTVERRLDRVEAALTPTQRVLAWLEEAHAYGSLSAYVDSLLDKSPDDFPINRLADDAATLGGRILIAPTPDYLERAFDATKYGEISKEPWLEISIPSVRDDSLAPEGAQVMSIYAHFVPQDASSMRR